MSNNNAILSTYRDIMEVVKTSLVSDLQSTFSEGTIVIDEDERFRLYQLIQTLVEQYSVNGYEQLQRVCTATTTSKSRKKK